MKGGRRVRSVGAREAQRYICTPTPGFFQPAASAHKCLQKYITLSYYYYVIQSSFLVLRQCRTPARLGDYSSRAWRARTSNQHNSCLKLREQGGGRGQQQQARRVGHSCRRVARRKVLLVNDGGGVARAGGPLVVGVDGVDALAADALAVDVHLDPVRVLHRLLEQRAVGAAVLARQHAHVVTVDSAIAACGERGARREAPCRRPPAGTNRATAATRILRCPWMDSL